jgi:ABC-type transport system involved in cytochrome bd biosynthesis fused ATPase/permease subunit
VLLLDEMTAHLDTRSEALMREVITDVARDCTVLLIVHRLCTVAIADNIVVMEAGMARAVGSHRSLLDSDSLYRELVHNQLMPAADEPAGSLMS